MARNRKKRPKIAAAPIPTKSPKIANQPPAFQGGILAWRFNAVDKAGPFPWTGLDDAVEYKEVLEKLIGFECMPENELISAGCHSIPTENLCSEAQARLVELELDDLDGLFSFRLTGKKRVFAVVRSKYVRILWYDPEHKVCPSKKKHT